MNNIFRDLLEVMMVVAVGGLLVSSLVRLKRHQLPAVVCAHCGRTTSRAYPLCRHCKASRDITG